MLKQTSAVAVRVLKQLIHDRRFLGLSLIMPVAIIFMLYIFFDSVQTPFMQVEDFVPPVSAFLVHFITYILCVIVLVRERTTNTLMRMFVSGYRRGSIISGYVLAYSGLATVQSLIVLVLVNLLFELNYALDTFLLIYAVIWLLAIISIALGIFVSNFARNEGQVLPFIPLVLVPSVFFSGMLVAVEDLPEWASVLSITTPMYYANEVISAILEDSSGLLIFGLIVYGVIVMSAATLTLREVD